MIRRYIIYSLAICAVVLLSACKKKISLEGFQRYQTFNEFTMKGEGKVVDTPFVYVKALDNEIMVVPSNDEYKLITYSYHPEGNYWSSGPDGWSENDEKVYRIFIKDTIFEQLISICSEYEAVISNDLFIKTKDELVNIILSTDELRPPKNTFEKILHACRNYKTERTNLAEIDEFQNRGKNQGYLTYTKQQRNDSIIFQCNTIKNVLRAFYIKNSLGDWGFQPGFNKIRSFDAMDKPDSHLTRDWAYFDTPYKRYVDISPVPDDQNVIYEKGNEIHLIASKRYIKEKCKIDLTLNLLIDENAKVVKVEFVESNGDSIREQDAIEQAMQFKYKTPAKRDGKPVKCWHWVKVRYYK